ncbi:hemolysin family protein [Ferrovibrio sp.]|uniref:hemolysin family protein n=1 Tax=Ferrovibrio sp. TaxID=1917215 RepID=UPI003D2A80EF
MPLSAELALIVALILLNGVLALSELAVVSARKTRLQLLAAQGNAGAEAALKLANDPGRFLSSVQIGITLVGIAAGAFSGATLADRLSHYLMATFGWPEAWSDGIAFAAVVSAVTYLSLIVGELVPKQIALRNAERMAILVARPMTVVARIASPAVSLLDVSARLVLRLLGAKSDAAEQVTEEEIKTLVAEAESAGVVEPAERAMIAAVMRLGDRPVRSVMTPRTEIDWIDLDAALPRQLATLRGSIHACLPAGHGGIDHVHSLLLVKDALDAVIDGKPLELAPLVRPAPILPETADVLEALEQLRHAPTGIALVVDEFGTLQGVVSAADIMESIVGELATPEGPVEPWLVAREDGSWLIDGLTPRHHMADMLGLVLPEGEDDYDTAAGFALARFGSIPQTGDRVDWKGWRFEVVDMDGRRIDKLLASRLDA